MSRSKLGPDGVNIQMTPAGNVALVIPSAYLDEPHPHVNGLDALLDPGSDVLALVLDRADARELSRMIELTARTGIAPLTGRLPDLDERAEGDES